ncbi:MAG: DUF302 domain-containing protein [Deltaproteobacteria bacterium]|nr:MAG: DUF302 domain-containing protein [Deltaproteobacteria bacterium]
MSTIPPLADSRYTLTRTLPDTTYDDAVAAVRAALSTEGFGVLTEIDVKATLNKKLGAETRPYVILGACNPPLAHQALQAEPAIGALLPCNVVVAATDEGGATVAAIDPVAMFEVVGREDIAPLAREVRARLERVLAALG